MSQTEKLLEYLKKNTHRWVYNFEIVQNLNILKYTGRISDLRLKGYKIEAKKFSEAGQGVWGYLLKKI